MALTLPQIEVFVLILARIVGVFLQAPVLSSRNFPVPLKIALAVWIAAILWMVIPLPRALPESSFTLIAALVNEVLIGALIGFVALILFAAVQAAGEIMDLQMGLSIATTFDPIFGSQISVVGRLAFFFGTIVFLTLNGHHLVLSALNQSFRAIPVGSFIQIRPALSGELIGLGVAMWQIAIQLAAPAVLIIFLSDFAFGIVSRVAPQVNVFMLGFQVKPFLGLWALMMGLPLMSKQIAALIARIGEEIFKILVLIR